MGAIHPPFSTHSNVYSLPGVVPDSTLRSYKVFGRVASTYEDTIIAGFVRAFDDGADIISASLGYSSGFPDSRIAV